MMKCVQEIFFLVRVAVATVVHIRVIQHEPVFRDFLQRPDVEDR